MKHFKTNNLITAFIFAIILAALIMTGCTESVPDTTSGEAGLYLLENTVVGLDGKEVQKDGEKVYGLAHNGDIISLEDGRIIVAAYNVEEFTCVEKAEVIDENDLKVNISAVSETGRKNASEPKTFSIKLSVTPDDVASKYIFVKTSGTDVVCFGENERSIYVEADDKGLVTLELTACGEGSGRFTVTNALGKVICTFTVKVEEGDEPTPTETPETNRHGTSAIVPSNNTKRPTVTATPTEEPTPTATPTEEPASTAKPTEKPVITPSPEPAPKTDTDSGGTQT